VALPVERERVTLVTASKIEDMQYGRVLKHLPGTRLLTKLLSHIHAVIGLVKHKLIDSEQLKYL